MERLPKMARRILLGLALVVVLALVFSIGSVIINQLPSTGRSNTSQQTTTPSTSTEPGLPSALPSLSENLPAIVKVTRQEIEEGWHQVANVPLSKLPPPIGLPIDSRRGEYDCAPTYRAIRSVGSRDVLTTNIRVSVQPKSFQEITITSLRIKAKPLQSTSVSSEKYLYVCRNPYDDNARGRYETIYAEVAEVAPNGVSAATSVSEDMTVSANNAEVWQSIEFELQATDNAYAWQIDLDYTNRGETYHEVLTQDIYGIPLVTEPGGSAQSFTDEYIWCANITPPSFQQYGLRNCEN